MKFFLTSILILILYSCTQNAPNVPKPRVFPRIDRSDTTTVGHNLNSFSFRYTTDANLKKQLADKPKQVWYNMIYPEFNATLYCSYFQITKDELSSLIQDNQHLLRKMASNYTDIYENNYDSADKSSTGKLYILDGNTISPIQFYLTDSTHYFIRGSLYYNVEVNSDSVASTTKSLESDIKYMMETFRYHAIN